MVLNPEDVLRLVLAALVGGLVGFEREYRDKAAGLRTSVLISLGSALFTLLSYRLGEGNDIRIAVGIVSGVGFLGAGVIMRESGQVTGLTTASTIWLVAALGMGIGGGQYALIAVVTAVVLVVLWGLRPMEAWVTGLRDERTYHVTLAPGVVSPDRIVILCGEAGLKVGGVYRGKKEGKAVCSWAASGPPSCHEQAQRRLLEDPQVEDLSF